MDSRGHSAPLIGVSCYLERVRYRSWDLPGAVLPRSYLDSVVAAGGMPVLLPPVGTGHAASVSRVDGLLIAGGPDVDPARYGGPKHPSVTHTHPDRDEAELRMLHAALAAEMPVLGVCRGMQVLNVAFGGTLHQHLPDLLGTARHQPAPATFGTIEARIEPGCRLATVLGDRVTAYCHHHQAVDDVGADLRPVAWAPDGTVEALELPAASFVVGVQWHPEEDSGDRRLFEAFVRAAAQHRARVPR